MPPVEALSLSDSCPDEMLVIEKSPKPNTSAKGAPTSPLSRRPRRSTSRAGQDKVVDTIEDEEDEDELETGGKKDDGKVVVPKPWNRGQHNLVDAPENGSVLKVLDEEGDGLFTILLGDGKKEMVSLLSFQFSSTSCLPRLGRCRHASWLATFCGLVGVHHCDTIIKRDRQPRYSTSTSSTLQLL